MLPCLGCGSCGIQTATSGTLSDGSGPDNYANNANCEWMIAPDGAGQVSISFTVFQTQSLFDYVRIFQCSDTVCTQQLQLSELSGMYSSVKTVNSATGFMKIVFTSDGSISFGGFNASWSSVGSLQVFSAFIQPVFYDIYTYMHAYTHTLDTPSYDFSWQVVFPCNGCASTCGVRVTANGTLSDGSGPANYQNNAECAWMIAPANAAPISMILLNFTDFSTVAQDTVRVYQCTDIPCMSPLLIAQLSGTYSSQQIISSGTGFTKVIFTSDSTSTSAGFSATWRLVCSLPLNDCTFALY
jgi:hypothetical protein